MRATSTHRFGPQPDSLEATGLCLPSHASLTVCGFRVSDTGPSELTVTLGDLATLTGASPVPAGHIQTNETVFSFVLWWAEGSH